MIITCLLNVPFTGVGQTSVAHIQDILDNSPKGISIPVLQPINNNDTIPLDEKAMVGDWSMYSKEPGVRTQVPYPIVLKNEQAYFDSVAMVPSANFTQDAFIFTQPAATDTTKSNCTITAFSPDAIKVDVIADSAGRLILQQNFYPHWYYQNGNEKKEVLGAGINFMSAPIVKGDNTVVFSFEPILIKRGMLVSLVSFILCCLFLLFLRTKPFFLS
jgi:hypothetical protein